MFAFLLTTTGRWIAGGVIVALLVGGGYWYIYHLRAKVDKLVTQVATLELKAEIIAKAQKATEDWQAKRDAIKRKASNEKEKIDKVVESGDHTAMRDLFKQHGLLPQSLPRPTPHR